MNKPEMDKNLNNISNIVFISISYISYWYKWVFYDMQTYEA